MESTPGGANLSIFPYKTVKGTTVFRDCETEEIQNMDVRDDDTWVLSFPRSGTTLTQEIVYMLKSKLDIESARTIDLDVRFPFLDICNPNMTNFRGLKAVEEQASPRLVKSHLHRHILPQALFSSKCKKIYVRRNPKDVFVSVFILTKFLRHTHPDFPIDKYLDMWLAGETYATPWWLHIHDFWSLRDDPTFLFLTYEEIVMDMPKAIRQIAHHLGISVTDTDVRQIAEHCSFNNMSKSKSANAAWQEECLTVDWKFGGHIRKGMIGGWREHLTSTMSDKIDVMVHEKLAHLHIPIDYGD